MEYKIIKEKNKYKNNLKWHLLGISENGTHSEWFKTKKEAIYKKYYYEILIPAKYETVNKYGDI